MPALSPLSLTPQILLLRHRLLVLVLPSLYLLLHRPSVPVSLYDSVLMSLFRIPSLAHSAFFELHYSHRTLTHLARFRFELRSELSTDDRTAPSLMLHPLYIQLTSRLVAKGCPFINEILGR